MENIHQLNTREWWFFIVSTIFLSIWIIAAAYSSPIYNWDLIPYVASALSYEITDPTLLHKTTYDSIKATVPEPIFAALISGAYPQHMFENAKDFISQLNFYEIKPLYIYLIYILSSMGVPLVAATLVISSLSVIAANILIYHWLSRYLSVYIAFLVTICVSVASRLADLSRASTPDALSALVILIALYLLIEKKLFKTTLVLLILSLFIRYNNIIFVGLFMLYYMYFDFLAKAKFKFSFVHAAFIVSIFSYFLIKMIYQPYGWWVLFHHGFVSYIYNPVGFDVPFSLALYIEALKTAALSLFLGGVSLPSVIYGFILISIIALHNSNSLVRRYNFLIYIIYLNFSAYFFLFPGIAQWDRFFTPFYVLVTIFAIINYRNKGLTATASTSKA